MFDPATGTVHITLEWAPQKVVWAGIGVSLIGLKHEQLPSSNEIAGGASSRVEKIANCVRIISGDSESERRFTSRIEMATQAALASVNQSAR